MNKDVCNDTVYKSIYEKHANNLRNLIYYKCGDLNQAEDVTHEAFIKLWDNCKKVVLEKAKSFLFTIANRLFLNEIEHQKVVLNFSKSNQDQVMAHDPDFILREKEFQSALEKAIGELPLSQREVFLMHRIDKMSYQEIADLQEVSIKAVHKRMYKAMDKLKNKVKELNYHKF